MTNRDLLNAFVGAYPAQPATAFWRAIEIGVLARCGLPEGLGLDLGCGDGILTDILLRETGPRTLIGVDIDPLETEAAARFPFYRRVHACPGDCIPEPDASFDFVLSNSVLEHIPDLEATIAEVSRLLRTDGRFVFTVPGPGFHENLGGSVLPFVNRAAYLGVIDRRLAHRHYLSPEQWQAMCARNGLVLDACRGYLDGRETRRWETLSRMTGGLLYSLLGEVRRPIEIQRRLGARDLQNKTRLPVPMARALAGLLSVGVPVDANASLWIAPEEASCLLVEGHRA
ncbi:MAG TPA: class I SAM-dependent methyltransferase [Xanthobacteraceae bacterium]